MISPHRIVAPASVSYQCPTKKPAKTHPESARPARKPPERNRRINFIRRNVAATSSNYSSEVYSSPSVSSYSESDVSSTTSESETSISLTSESSTSTTSKSESSTESDSTISSRTANYTLAKYLECYDRMYKRGDLKLLNSYEYQPRQPSVSLNRQRTINHSPVKKPTFDDLNIHVDQTEVQGDTVKDQTDVKVDLKLPSITTVAQNMMAHQFRRTRNMTETHRRKFRLPDMYAKIYGNSAKSRRDHSRTVWENYRMKIKSDTLIKKEI